MQNDLIKQWTELNKAAMEAVKELGEINTSAMTRLTERQMEVVKLYMEGGTKQLEALSEAKGMQDVVTTQSRLVSEFNEKLMDNARKTVEVLTDVKTELSAWAEKGIEKATTTLSQNAENK